ncbi:MAG: hypothetical protein IJ153_01805 [Clostridia bacterium]|nr:hypothetical protein [Clostridia bacterium]
MRNQFAEEYIRKICELYGDRYDDREEDSRLGGEDWQPGQKARHMSLRAFQRKLKNEENIQISTGKIQKILISGGCWSTERSRIVGELYHEYTARRMDGGENMDRASAIQCIAMDLGIDPQTVSINLPYDKVVYELEDKTKNAIYCERYRKK